MPPKPTPAPPHTPGPPPELWPAMWITHPSSFSQPTGVYHFRRVFDLPQKPGAFRVRVSADQRYELFVNGARVRSGPPRSDVPHWRYDTVELAPHLRPGRNVVAAVVWFIAGELGPWAQMGHAPGFLLCGDEETPAANAVNTPGGWKCLRSEGYTFERIDPRDMPFYMVTGPGDRLDASKYPWGWEQAAFDDSSWSNPHPMNPGSPRGARDAPSPWGLVANPLPPLEENSELVTAVLRSEGVMVENHRLGPDMPVHVPARTRAALLLDLGHLTTGYPELAVEGGRGGTVRMRYAEALFGGAGQNEKGHRDEWMGRVLRGNHDTFLPETPMGAAHTYRPLYWRTFRYLQVEVETADEPLTLHGLNNRFSAYPFTEVGHFQSSDPSLAKIWEVGWRTARLCAHETYMDCPYYEQLQYGGDTRIQCLISYYVSGDARLARNAIRQLDDSRLSEGITQSRYPCYMTQIIPPFALWWIGMVHDYWRFHGDGEFVGQMLRGARSVLEWWISYLRPDDLLGPLPWWNFVDWAREFPDGVPPGVQEGGSSILSLQLVLALRETAELEAALGLEPNARRYRELAARISQAVHRACWDVGRGLLADTPKRERFSQHATTLGILSETLRGPEVRSAAEKLLSEKPDHLAQTTFYFRYYLHRALVKAGLGDQYLEWLEPWRDMLRIGLTTWAETPEPTRSDCHAWSAHPNVGLLQTVLGVEPLSPGFRSVLVQPHLGKLESAEGLVAHPRGVIAVKLRREAGKLRGEVLLPEHTDGVFRHPGGEQKLRPGRNVVGG